jgi:uncharacterized protein DUF3866
MRRIPVLVLAVNEQRAPAEWAAAQVAPGLRIGSVETMGGPVALTEALEDGAETHGWEALIVGPGSSELDSEAAVKAALDSANSAMSLGLETAIAPRLSGSDPDPRHRGLSRDTEEVLEALRGGVRVPVPEIDAEAWPTGEDIGAGEGTPLDRLREACGDRHDVWVRPARLAEYAASASPATIGGRGLAEDRLFFAAALAAGDALATLASERRAV